MSDTVKEMISAYVTGCMDFRNLQPFIEYIDEGNYIDELGELQNIAALIPILLEREVPPASLQNDIFSQIPDSAPQEEEPKRVKRKVNLSEIIKEELAEEEEKKEEREEEIEIPENVSFTSLNRDTVAKDVAEKIEEEIFASKKKSKREEKKEAPIVEEKEDDGNPYPHVKIKASEEPKEKEETIVIPPEDEQHEKPFDEARYEKEIKETYATENKSDSKMKIAAGAGILLALIFMILYFSSKSAYNDEIEELRKTVKADKMELEDKNEFINQNLPLIEIFELKDLVMVELSSTDNSGKTEARILISPSAQRGIIQFLNIPELNEQESLQLWAVNKGQSYSIGIFHPTPERKFYRLSKIPFRTLDEIELFRITKEPHSGSEFPSGNTVYFGAIRIK